jgi:3'(2'), 5'-bisphosphate nucleotidase
MPGMITLTKAQLQNLLKLVKLAGEDILQIYQNPETTQLVTKADTSPLTAADLAAHKRLVAGLPHITSDPLPILSEEGVPEDYEKRHQWQSFWLIDPLDGTKEFLARNGQFTVNVALIHKGSAVLGVVYQPVTQKFYWAQSNTGAWRQIGEETAVPIFCEVLESRQQQKLSLRALVSQHHHSSASQEKLSQIQKHWPGNIEILPLGSSLKICAIAEGSADVYLRIGPTNEWDTAAAQAVLEAAGGQLVSLKSPAPFTYNQRNTLLNGDFCACSNPDLILNWLTT